MDRVLADDAPAFAPAAHDVVLALAALANLHDRIAAEAAPRAADAAIKPLAAYRAEELERVRRSFYGFDPSYHVARHHFVALKP